MAEEMFCVALIGGKKDRLPPADILSRYEQVMALKLEQAGCENIRIIGPNWEPVGCSCGEPGCMHHEPVEAWRLTAIGETS